MKTLTSRFRRANAPLPSETPEAEPATASAEISTAGAEPKATEAAAADASPKPGAPPKINAPAADAAASAVKASRLVEGARLRKAGRRVAAAATRIVPADLGPRVAGFGRKAGVPAAAAACLMVAAAIGYGAGARGPGAPGVDADTTRLAAEVKAMRIAIEGVRAERDHSRGEILARQAQLGERVDRLAQDIGGRIGRVGEAVDRNGREVARVATLGDRVERLEKAPVPTPPARPTTASAASTAPAGVPADVRETGSIPEQKPAPEQKPPGDPRKTQIEGFFVRDFEEGFALIETKAGRFIEVAVGQTLPGIGKVETIERRGRQWVVVTPKGYIAER